MTAGGNVRSRNSNGITVVAFSHPKGNSLPGELLDKLAQEISDAGVDERCRVIVLRSDGEKTFCGGASFDELLAVKTPEEGTAFFSGFAKVILAIRNCPKFVICRVQGRAVGGGVGLVAAADYSLATTSASIRLSELALGIGPFVVGPAVERKVGPGPFSALAIDALWRDAEWGQRHGLYASLYNDVSDLDEALSALVQRLSRMSPKAMKELKSALWAGTEHWEELLPERAEISGRLVIGEEAQEAIRLVKTSAKR